MFSSEKQRSLSWGRLIDVFVALAAIIALVLSSIAFVRSSDSKSTASLGSDGKDGKDGANGADGADGATALDLLKILNLNNEEVLGQHVITAEYLNTHWRHTVYVDMSTNAETENHTFKVHLPNPREVKPGTQLEIIVENLADALGEELLHAFVIDPPEGTGIGGLQGSQQLGEWVTAFSSSISYYGVFSTTNGSGLMRAKLVPSPTNWIIECQGMVAD
jgi:hypothetical protein